MTRLASRVMWIALLVPMGMPAGAQGVASVREPPPRTVSAPWFDDRLSEHPDGWRYSAALEALGASRQAQALREELLHRYLAELAGAPFVDNKTIGQAANAGGAAQAPAANRTLRQRWTELVNQHLRVSLPAAAVPVPPELAADAPRLREAAPGLWSLQAADGSLRSRVWWLQLRSTATRPLPLAEFRVRAPLQPPSTEFQCTLPRYSELALALPGRETAYLCRASAIVSTQQSWDELVRALRSGAAPMVQLQPTDLDDARSVQLAYVRLEAPHRAAAEALVAAAGAVAPEPAPAPAVATARPGQGPSPTAAAAAAARVPGGGDRWRLVGIVAASLAVFSLAASLAGRRAAVILSWLLLTGLALLAPIATFGLAPMSPMRIVGALLAPALATLLLVVGHALLFGERFGVLRALGRRWAGPLMDDMADRIFGGRRG